EREHQLGDIAETDVEQPADGAAGRAPQSGPGVRRAAGSSGASPWSGRLPTPLNWSPAPACRWLSTASIREAALEAVRDSKWTWHLVFPARSIPAVRAAALAGLAVTPPRTSAVGRSLRILSEKNGMPPLPNLDFAIFERVRP